MTRGILYISPGNFVKEAKISAKRLDEEMPDVSISIITDEQVSAECFDNIIKKNIAHGWEAKPNNISLSPYDTTIYIDTDTYIVDDISEIFNLLERYDMAAALQPTGKTSIIRDVPQCMPEYNTGVIGFKSNGKVMETFELWKNVYNSRPEKEDQPSFRKALFKSGSNIVTLPSEYNCRWTSAGLLSTSVKLFHGRIVEFEEEIQGQRSSIDVKDAVKKINKNHHHRVFMNYDGKIKIKAKNESPDDVKFM